ncbi:aminotransferase class III-fold pyridoxal phosphate-dependent enzyme [Stappia indica]|uniref:aminotransferase class III-fold pyridoxal phosphate-dependent enzyme n=1 Tax=Stappia indica TaxID=538381 RepID=UPI001CD213BE|nr:aminotransferase class III-fold pyridoxal phosphate-dependent enzyme [Stappia indica]MCA1298744.1 aminotransferase class III-fold pyridoxal phosphate-dependent enzyme [Stappia indica]
MSLIKPVSGKVYPVAVTASGVTITSDSGQEWLDGSSGAIACSIGHGHPHVVECIRRQLETASFLYRTQFANEPAERLAARLCDKLGYASAFFVNSGSEAVETAVRLAQQYWREAGQPGKTRVLSRRISYHGATIGALGLSGHWPRRRSCGGGLSGDPSLPTPYCLRCPLGQRPDSCGFACARALEDEIRLHGADAVAAVIIEPIVGASGAAIVPRPGYLKAIREICDRHDVLLIADEVLTGLGRTGAWLGMDHDAVHADIVCLGKGLNAGYLPISGVLVDARIQDLLTARAASFTLGHTHSNHPVAAAAANAVLDVLESEDLIARAASTGAYLGARLQEMSEDLPFVGDVRGRGMFWGLELIHDDISYAPFDPELNAADCVVRHAFDAGVLIYPAAGFIAGSAGDAVIVAPPLNSSHAVIDTIIERLAIALSGAGRELLVRRNAPTSNQQEPSCP